MNWNVSKKTLAQIGAATLAAVLAFASFAVGANADAASYFLVYATPAAPALWREAMAQAAQEIGLPLDAPFAASPYSEQLYAPNPAPEWLVYETTAAGGTVCVRQIIFDEATPITVYIAKLSAPGKEAPAEAFGALARAAMRAMEPTLTEAETEQMVAELTEAQQTEPNEAHDRNLRGFSYSVTADQNGALIDVTVQYTHRNRAADEIPAKN